MAPASIPTVSACQLVNAKNASKAIISKQIVLCVLSMTPIAKNPPQMVNSATSASMVFLSTLTDHALIAR